MKRESDDEKELMSLKLAVKPDTIMEAYFKSYGKH